MLVKGRGAGAPSSRPQLKELSDLRHFRIIGSHQSWCTVPELSGRRSVFKEHGRAPCSCQGGPPGETSESGGVDRPCECLRHWALMVSERRRGEAESREHPRVVGIRDPSLEGRRGQDLHPRQRGSVRPPEVLLAERASAKGRQSLGQRVHWRRGQIQYPRPVAEIEPPSGLARWHELWGELLSRPRARVIGETPPKAGHFLYAKAPVRAAWIACITAPRSPSASTSSGRRSLRWGLIPRSQSGMTAGS